MGTSTYSATASTSQRVLTAVLVLVVVASAVGLVLVLGPFNWYKQSEFLIIFASRIGVTMSCLEVLVVGVLYGTETIQDRRLVAAMNTAVEDISKLVREQGILSKPVPSILIRSRQGNESVEEAVARLREEGVGVFLGNTIDTQDKAGIVGEELLFLSHSSHNHSSTQQISPSSSLLAHSYLQLIHSTNPSPGKALPVLPVMRDDVLGSELYRALVEAVKLYPSITMMSPVVYTPTQYQRSDAFQVVSMLGNFIAVQPRAEVRIVTGYGSNSKAPAAGPGPEWGGCCCHTWRDPCQPCPAPPQMVCCGSSQT